MNRRTLLAGLTLGISTTIAGCISAITESDGGNQKVTDKVIDAPKFKVDDNAPAQFILLTAQPQKPNGIVLHEEFEIAIALGNFGSVPLAGEVSVKLIPPDDNFPTQTSSVTIEGDDTIPSGAARFFRTGPFNPPVLGTWELVAGPEIELIHPEYTGTFQVHSKSEDKQ